MPPLVAAATLPPFSNMCAVCARCGARWGIRVHFDRDCALVRGDHFHRVCRCGYRWVERTLDAGRVDVVQVGQFASPTS